MTDDPKRTSSTDPIPPSRSDLREIEPVPSGIRKAPLELEWLELLFDLSAELPILEGSRSVVRAVIDRLAGAFPGVAFGACVVDVDRDEQIIEVRVPPGCTTPRGHDPSRLFAD